MSQLNLYFEHPHSSWSVGNLFSLLRDKLQEKFSSIHFNAHNTGTPLHRENISINSAHLFTIVNPLNNKYIIVSFWDKNVDLFNPAFRDISKLVQLITSSGINIKEYALYKNIHTDLNLPEIQHILTPYTYIPYTVEAATYIEQIYKHKNLKKNKNIIFRGMLYGDREILSKSNLNSNIIILDERKNIKDFLQEQSEQIICLSLNGAAEICHRDIELFGLGKAVMRPKFNVQFNDPLMPDKHYISLGDYDFAFCRSNMPIQELISSINVSYTKYINNPEYISNIERNAREWYIKNCTLQGAADLFISLVDINRLF